MIPRGFNLPQRVLAPRACTWQPLWFCCSRTRLHHPPPRPLPSAVARTPGARKFESFWNSFPFHAFLPGQRLWPLRHSSRQQPNPRSSGTRYMDVELSSEDWTARQVFPKTWESTAQRQTPTAYLYLCFRSQLSPPPLWFTRVHCVHLKLEMSSVKSAC